MLGQRIAHRRISASVDRMDIRIAAVALVLVGFVVCSRDTAPPVEAAASAGVEKTLFIASERKPCTGVAPMECLQVRESPDLPWQYFYSEIEGFTFEPGFDYELRVREEKVANPPADGSSLRWTLVKVVSKRAALPTPAP
jgi:hypothetical protein